MLFIFGFGSLPRFSYLRPTAAYFLSDLHIKRRVTIIDIKASIIDPGTGISVLFL